jgi:hypothetical protein
MMQIQSAEHFAKALFLGPFEPVPLKDRLRAVLVPCLTDSVSIAPQQVPVLFPAHGGKLLRLLAFSRLVFDPCRLLLGLLGWRQRAPLACRQLGGQLVQFCRSMCYSGRSNGSPACHQRPGLACWLAHSTRWALIRCSARTLSLAWLRSHWPRVVWSAPFCKPSSCSSTRSWPRRLASAREAPPLVRVKSNWATLATGEKPAPVRLRGSKEGSWWRRSHKPKRRQRASTRSSG